jgi:hypothetical protein
MTKQSTEIKRRKNYKSKKPVDYKAGASSSGTYPLTLRLETENVEKLAENARLLSVSVSTLGDTMIAYCNALIEAKDPATVEMPKHIRWAAGERQNAAKFTIGVDKAPRR